MFNQSLFYELCKNYGVPLDKTTGTPAMKDEAGTRPLSDADVERAFAFLRKRKHT